MSTLPVSSSKVRKCRSWHTQWQRTPEQPGTDAPLLSIYLAIETGPRTAVQNFSRQQTTSKFRLWSVEFGGLGSTHQTPLVDLKSRHPGHTGLAPSSLSSTAPDTRRTIVSGVGSVTPTDIHVPIESLLARRQLRDGLPLRRSRIAGSWWRCACTHAGNCAD